MSSIYNHDYVILYHLYNLPIHILSGHINIVLERWNVFYYFNHIYADITIKKLFMNTDSFVV